MLDDDEACSLVHICRRNNRAQTIAEAIFYSSSSSSLDTHGDAADDDGVLLFLYSVRSLASFFLSYFFRVGWIESRNTLRPLYISRLPDDQPRQIDR